MIYLLCMNVFIIHLCNITQEVYSLHADLLVCGICQKKRHYKDINRRNAVIKEMAENAQHQGLVWGINVKSEQISFQGWDNLILHRIENINANISHDSINCTQTRPNHLIGLILSTALHDFREHCGEMNVNISPCTVSQTWETSQRYQWNGPEEKKLFCHSEAVKDLPW